MSSQLEGYDESFWLAVRSWLEDGPEAWATLDDQQLITQHFLSSAETARRGGLRPGPLHQQLFEALVERLDGDARWELLGAYHAKLRETPGLLAPLLPFFLLDPEFDVAATAGCYLVDLWAPEGDDPLAGARAFAGFGLTHDASRVRGITLAALVGLGDRRLRELWNGRWRELPRPVRQELWQYVGGLGHTEAVECLLAWLEAGPEEDFGGVAGALFAIADRQPEICEERRGFGRPGGVVAGFEVVERWPVAAYGQRIAPRIRALAARESGPPYVIPWVAEAWGVDVSDVSPTGEPWVREAG